MDESPAQIQTFIVDMDEDRDSYLTVDAYTVWNLDGDLVFSDEQGRITDMIAAGWWKRCKVGKLP